MAVSDDSAQAGNTTADTQSASFYQLIFDSLSIQVAVLDQEGRIQTCNSAWRKNFAGAAPEAARLMVQGHYLKACEAALAANPSRTSETYTRMHAYVAALRNIISGTVDAFSMEYAVPGHDAWYRVHLNRCHSGPGKVVIQRRNITTEKISVLAAEHSRQFLQTLIDLLPARIVWKDREGRYQGANRAFLDDAGLPDVVGKTTRDMPWGQAYGQQIEAEEQRLMATGEPQLGNDRCA